MALSPRLELRQGQSLVITPQLQQAIKLLQLSNIELESFVEAELERNPLLAREEPDGDPEAAQEVSAPSLSGDEAPGEVVEQRDHLLGELRDRVAPHLPRAIRGAVPERVERHHPVAPPRKVARERGLHLLRHQQARHQDRRPLAPSVDRVGELVTLIAEVPHGFQDTLTGRLASQPVLARYLATCGARHH